MKISQYQLASVIVVATYVGPVYADGLGGLGAARALFLIVAAFVVLGVLAFVLNLAQASRSETGEHGKSNRFALITSIIYLVVASPLFIWVLIYPKLDFVIYLIVIMYLGVITTTLLQVFANRRYVFIFVGAFFLVILLRTPEIISYTEYQTVDNVPLPETIELSKQMDNQYIHLADGRIFRFTERYNSSGQDKKFADDAKLMIEETLTSKESGVYILHGLRVTNEYYRLKFQQAEPLITIPIKSVRLDKNEPYHVGKVELLDDSWRADDRALARAISRNCCSSAWVEELSMRGAPRNREMLQDLAEKVPENSDVDGIAVSLIKFGVNVNAKDQRGETALYAAIDNVDKRKYGQPHFAERYKSYITTLLENGAYPNAVTKDGDTPLYHTIVRHNYELAHLLLAHGADPRQRTMRRETAYEAVQEQMKNAVTDNERKVLEKLVAEMNN